MCSVFSAFGPFEFLGFVLITATPPPPTTRVAHWEQETRKSMNVTSDLVFKFPEGQEFSSRKEARVGQMSFLVILCTLYLNYAIGMI